MILMVNGRGQERYVANFTQSMGLMLGEFYENFPVRFCVIYTS